MRESVAFRSFSKTAFVGGHNTFCSHKELKSFRGVLDLCPFEGYFTEYYYVNKQEFQRTNCKLKRAEVARFWHIPSCPIDRVFSFNACSISVLQTTHSRAVQYCAQPEKFNTTKYISLRADFSDLQDNVDAAAKFLSKQDVRNFRYCTALELGRWFPVVNIDNTAKSRQPKTTLLLVNGTERQRR